MSKYPANPRMQAHRKPKRFLFIISDTGGGHRASANAVKDAMFSLYGSAVEIDTIDLFVEMDRWPFYRFPDWYPQIISKNSVSWAVSYHLSNRVRLMKTMSRIVWPYARHALCEVLRQHPADVIVSFHPIPNYGLQMALRHLGWQIPVATVAVDMDTAHASWFVPGAKIYLVPTEGVKALALRWGIPAEYVFVTGMPTRLAFRESMALSQSTARMQLNIPQDKPVVLIVGGGDGMGPLAQVVRAINHKNIDLHITVIVGRNQSLFEELQRADYPQPLHVEGFVDNMEIWMRAADILVTKAGPNTISEAFISGLPIILYTALPGQEEGNITHVVKNGAGLWAPQPKVAASAVEYLIKHPDVREKMAAQSHAMAHPYASHEIAAKLWDLVSNSSKTSPQKWGPNVRRIQTDRPYTHLEES
jgi:1,2-diacylglycerol 3-beta-galactosyltransferase